MDENMYIDPDQLDFEPNLLSVWGVLAKKII